MDLDAQVPPEAEARSGQDELAAAVARSREAWQHLGRHLLSITPSALARSLLAVGALGAVVWLVVASGPALLPFVVGGVLAYTVLPLVNFLDRLLPRFLAALLGVLAMLGAVGAILWVLVPPMIAQLVNLVGAIPPGVELGDMLAPLMARIETLPAPVQRIVLDGINAVIERMLGKANLLIPTLLSPGGLLNLLNAVGFVLGLLVLPTWLLTALKDQPRAAQAIVAGPPAGLRADFRAVVRILDRAAGTFLRGQVLLGLAVGVATYLAIGLLEQLGLPQVHYKLSFSVLAGLMQLIPEVGPIVNIIFTTLLALVTVSREAALMVFLLYVAIQFVTKRLVGDRVEERMINAHPVILVLVIVALSQLGTLWLFLAAPVAAVARDLFRYVYGRVSDPPLPAGLLPGGPLPVPQPARRQSSRRGLRRRAVPSARGRA
jgi:predicted PurR-regulated permease PerM